MRTPAQSLVWGAGLFQCLNTLPRCGGRTRPGVLMVTAGRNQAVPAAGKSDVKWRWAFSQEGARLFTLCSGQYLGGYGLKVDSCLESLDERGNE